MEVDTVAAQGGPVLLVTHYLIGGFAQLLMLLAKRSGSSRGTTGCDPLKAELPADPVVGGRQPWLHGSCTQTGLTYQMAREHAIPRAR